MGTEIMSIRRISRLFKRNLVLPSMMAVLQATQTFRSLHWVYRSSKKAMLSGIDGDRIESESFGEFVRLIEAFDRRHGFVKNMFPKRQNTE